MFEEQPKWPRAEHRIRQHHPQDYFGHGEGHVWQVRQGGGQANSQE